jgi:hypothetical protein
LFRGLVGSEMCIRDREYTSKSQHSMSTRKRAKDDRFDSNGIHITNDL